ncbi:transposase family protein [Streptomyces sp. NPDC007251]|uniref:transposase family protein n=1 Tax=Streptomyces sp. NPDC007251 TaxID=3154483 RepID=UPI0033D6B2EC
MPEQIPGLLERLAEVPDPRDPRGVRHALVVVLALTACAVGAGSTSLPAVGESDHRRGRNLAIGALRLAGKSNIAAGLRHPSRGRQSFRSARPTPVSLPRRCIRRSCQAKHGHEAARTVIARVNARREGKNCGFVHGPRAAASPRTASRERDSAMVPQSTPPQALAVTSRRRPAATAGCCGR